MLDESEELLGGVCDETEIIHEQNDGHEDEVLGGGQRDVGKNIIVGRGRGRLRKNTTRGEIVYLPRVCPFQY